MLIYFDLDSYIINDIEYSITKDWVNDYWDLNTLLHLFYCWGIESRQYLLDTRYGGGGTEEGRRGGGTTDRSTNLTDNQTYDGRPVHLLDSNTHLPPEGLPVTGDAVLPTHRPFKTKD